MTNSNRSAAFKKVRDLDSSDIPAGNPNERKAMGLSERLALMELEMLEIGEEIEARPGQPLEDDEEFKHASSSDQSDKREEVELARPFVRTHGNPNAKNYFNQIN